MCGFQRWEEHLGHRWWEDDSHLLGNKGEAENYLQVFCNFFVALSKLYYLTSASSVRVLRGWVRGGRLPERDGGSGSATTLRCSQPGHLRAEALLEQEPFTNTESDTIKSWFLTPDSIISRIIVYLKVPYYASHDQLFKNYPHVQSLRQKH